ncbi:MAG: hypothetical protein IT204_25565 [Fimbriimonadaceae bacterium]|nr:hypothetical protein [Fimbriimonadaceae bacterium]
MEMVKDALNWFEIPVADFERARRFYSTIFDFDMPVQPMGDQMLGFLLHEMGQGVGGAIIHGDGSVPSKDGTCVYLNGGNDLQVVLDRVVAAGGTILCPKTQITPEYGYCAWFGDTEGNRVGLHSMH